MPRLVAAVLFTAIVVTGLTPTPAAAAPSTAAQSPAAAPPTAAASDLVLIDEVANTDADSVANSFIELRNWGDTAVDLTGWQLFRCSQEGLRANVDRPETDLSGLVIPPGEVVTLSSNGLPGDRQLTQGYPLGGFGLYLEAPGGVLADRVGIFANEPWPTESECTPSEGNLPNVLIGARDESWQRVADTGDIDVDWQIGTATPGAVNGIQGQPRAAGGVVVSELAGGGPDGPTDDFIELRNDGTRPVDIAGWTLERCTAFGRLLPAGRELVIPDGTVLQPGDTWVAGGPGFGTREPDAHYDDTFGDIEFGALLRDDEGRLADRVAVSHYADSQCQDEGAKLPAVLDSVAGESWQLGPTSPGSVRWIVAPRTPGAANARLERSLFRTEFDYPPSPGVAISEIATDPAQNVMPAGIGQQNWIELGNYSDEPVDIGGWNVRRCTADGSRAYEVQFTVPDGTELAPGAVYLAARSGTAAADGAEASYDTSLNFLGTGLWLADAGGRRVDSVGIYSRNEMDSANVVPSVCTKGIALTTYEPDRMLQETFQRSRFTGVDDDDFVTGPGTPGVIDEVQWEDPLLRVDGVVAVAEEGRQTARPGVVAGGGARSGSGGSVSMVRGEQEDEQEAVVVLEAWGGVSEGPLVAARGDDEHALDPAAPGAISDTGYLHPYQRIVIDGSALGAGTTIGWIGQTEARHEVQLSVWNTDAWRLVGAAAADPVTGAVDVTGTLEAGDLRDGTVSLLVQDGPRTEATIASGRDGRLQDPDAYDLAISHITDTQYLSEAYPEVYTELVSWIADNADDRKIAFAAHTGDLVQNWVDPNQSDDRARREFERASAIQAILDEAGVPNSVLPGNHDNKRGVSNALFNEYFPPSRYADSPWYGGSIAPGDNSANFSTFERGGARFLMLSLPYAYGEAEIAWASEVVTAHPDHNVVLSTHEHLLPKNRIQDAVRSTESRWLSRGDELWERVVAPNRNVVLVLSGHFHGLGQITTENAGGIAGHTVVELLADYQEFRTHTGERATGFQRLLQLDLAAGTVAVDTFSVRLAASASHPYDYLQFRPDNLLDGSLSNARPWKIVAAGLQERYTDEDDEFTATVAFQYAKSVETLGVVAG